MAGVEGPFVLTTCRRLLLGAARTGAATGQLVEPATTGRRHEGSDTGRGIRPVARCPSSAAIPP